MVQQRDRATGDVYMIVNGNNRFLEGYLIRTVALKSLELLEVREPQACCAQGCPGQPRRSGS